MWPRRYFAARHFAPRYFPQFGDATPTGAATPGPAFASADTNRVLSRSDTGVAFGTPDTARVFSRRPPA